MKRNHTVYRGYLIETGEIWETLDLRSVYHSVLMAMKSYIHIGAGSDYMCHIYKVDERIKCGEEDEDECLTTVYVFGSQSWREIEFVKGYWED